MIETIIGGSGSGKSEYAENHALELYINEEATELIYIATMMPFGNESKLKIQRHREMRKDKNFATVECFTNLKSLDIPIGSIVLLECMSNLIANEMFSAKKEEEDICHEIMTGIRRLEEKCKAVVIVTNDIFQEGYLYDESTMKYMRCLAGVNKGIVGLSERVVEVVCSIPIVVKN